MSLWRTFALVALLPLACRTGLQDLATDAPPMLQGGSRLQLRVIAPATDGDAMVFRSFHDVTLATDCEAHVDANGVERCLPLVVGLGVYLDAACTIPGVYDAADVLAPGQAVRVNVTAPDECKGSASTSTTARLSGGAARAFYQRSPAGECLGGASGLVYDVEAIPVERWVAFTRKTAAIGTMNVTLRASEDGAVQLVETASSATHGRCEMPLGSSYASQTACTPSPVTPVPRHAFSDPECTREVFPQAASCEPPVLPGDSTAETCWLPSQWFAPGERLPVFQRGTAGCSPNADLALYANGDPLDARRFPLLDRVAAGTMGRLRAVRFAHAGHAVFELQETFLDGGTLCSPIAFDDGVERCVDQPATAVGPARTPAFADPSCTIPLVVHVKGVCGEEPRVVVENVGDHAAHVYRWVAVHRGETWQKSGDACISGLGGDWIVMGEELPRDHFVRLEERLVPGTPR